MNVVLLGYGKMGHEIERILILRSHIVITVVNSETDWENKIDKIRQADVAIEFSTPKTVLKNIANCFNLNIPIVVGTTGWYGYLPEIKEECINNNKSFFTASNFSIGVNLFFELNKYLAKLMNGHEEYEVEMTEVHHTQKLDAPSGTAITLADDIVRNLENKNNWSSQKERTNKELFINSLREGDIPGTHIVTYSSETDLIEIKHEAKSRRGFALGAVLAAEFLIGKVGYYEMKDLLDLKL